MEKEGIAMKGRAIIDTRSPFRSVKEAVVLFGERVLVGEIYAKQLQEIQSNSKSENKEQGTTPLGSVSKDLEETKENLKKAKVEGNYMANCLKSLKEELEETKKELLQLKATKDVDIISTPEIEELKFVETNNTNTNANTNTMTMINHVVDHDHDDDENEMHKKKFVSFASPPSLTKDIMNNNNNNISEGGENVKGGSKLGKAPSFRKEGKKKPLVPIVNWLFSRKKKDVFEGSAHRSPRV